MQATVAKTAATSRRMPASVDRPQAVVDRRRYACADMHIDCHPPISDWPLRYHDHPCRSSLIGLINSNADRLGTGRLDAQDLDANSRPIIATGHQPWLWHPGIMAKYLAAYQACATAGRPLPSMFHVIVDQDDRVPMALEVPVVVDKRVTEQRIEFAGPVGPEGAQQNTTGVASASSTPIDFVAAQSAFTEAQRLSGLTCDLNPLIEAWRKLGEQAPTVKSLAEQLALVLGYLLEPYIGQVPVVFASQLSQWSWFEEVWQRMQAEPRACVEAYNRAALAEPDAGVALLGSYSDRIELPVWALVDGKPRQRVWIQLKGQEKQLMIDGQVAAEPMSLAPRALLMTALLRSSGCDLFVHGRGGELYDRVTEKWWSDWFGTTLAPMATVSCDLTLAESTLSDLPLADERQVQAAVWRRHHLPHNIDRELELDIPEAQRKRYLLEHMNDDNDPDRRAKAFNEIHQLNRKLVQAYPHAVAEADKALADARLGVANRQVAGRRDWCFALYPARQLAQLQDGFKSDSAKIQKTASSDRRQA